MSFQDFYGPDLLAHVERLATALQERLTGIIFDIARRILESGSPE